jgi:hypothetical protein
VKFRGTLIALVLAVGLGAYVLYSVRHEKRVASKRAELSRLIPVAPADVVRITCVSAADKILLERRGQTWVISHPIFADCDLPVVHAFLDTLAAARIEDEVGGGDPVRYGLDHPAAVVEIAEASGQKHTLRFGRINPLQTLVYVLVDDSDQVRLTTSALLTFALTSDFGWRDKRMIDLDPESVARMEFHTLNAGTLAVRRDPEIGWVDDGPLPWRVDPVRVRGLLLALARLRAVGVSAEDKLDRARFGLDNRRTRAALQSADGNATAEVVFGFAKDEGSYFAIVADKPEVFRVDGSVVDTFVEFAREPRDRRLLPFFDPDSVTSVEVSGPADRFTLERRSHTRWVVTAAQKADSTFALDPGKVLGMLEQLGMLTITEFPPSQPAAALVEPPHLQIILHGRNGPLSGLRVGSKDPHGMLTFARGWKDRAAFLVSPAQLINLPFDLQRLGTGETEVPVGAERS